jgi:hypothetical protein
MDQPRRSRQVAPPPRAVNPVWTGLALGGVVQRQCASCAGDGPCPACEEEQQTGAK